MIARLSPRLVVALATSAVLASALSCAGARSDLLRPAPITSDRAAEARAAHVLSRLTFGPRPGDVERVLRMGIDRWIDRQLRPESIADTAAVTALAGCWAWSDSVDSAVASMSGPVTLTSTVESATGRTMGSITIVGGFLGLVTRDSARRAERFGAIYLDNGQLLACRLARVEASDRQLLEVMTDFWENHFSVSASRLPTRGSLIEWDRAIIRPRALGRFRDLLGAVARSPAMLAYLDNAVSTADSAHPTLKEYLQARDSGADPLIGQRPGRGLNENYARELLELHTLGVDGGYTQADVIDVARALTGWTHSMAPVNGRFVLPRGNGGPARFRFDSSAHDADAKVVLGHTLPAGRGIEDGDELLDILAAHPSTARFIARKLAVRFVSDTPPDALVDRAAATFRRTDGDIREVVRTLVTSPEFLSPDVYGAKVKSPLELVLSMRRALAAPIDTAAEVIDLLLALDQPPFGKLTPEGWPETGPAWLTAGAFRVRVDLAVRVAQGEVPSIPVTAWPGWSALSRQPFDAQMDGVIRSILNGQVSTETRAAMTAARPRGGEPDTAESRELTLRELIAMALSSAEFQRR